MTDQLSGALVACPVEKLRDLVLQRSLQDQPRAKTANRLDRVLISAGTGQRHIQF